jgi:hypothetical protein
MKELLAQLARSRILEERAVTSRKEFEAKFRESPNFQMLLQQEKDMKMLRELSENELRRAAKDQYDTDLIKKPEVGGYVIKITRVISIRDEETVREWCFTNFRPALKLDQKTFCDAAKDGNVPSTLFKEDDEPKVNINSDLSEFLEKADPLVTT